GVAAARPRRSAAGPGARVGDGAAATVGRGLALGARATERGARNDGSCNRPARHTCKPRAATNNCRPTGDHELDGSPKWSRRQSVRPRTNDIYQDRFKPALPTQTTCLWPPNPLTP